MDGLEERNMAAGSPIADDLYGLWRSCTKISVSEAVNTRGAVLFTGPGVGGRGVAVVSAELSTGRGDQTADFAGVPPEGAVRTPRPPRRVSTTNPAE